MKLILEFEVVHFMFELILNQLFYYVLYHHLLTGLKSINKSEYVVKSHALIVTVSKFKGKRSDCIITIFSGNFTRFFVFYSFCFIVHLCKVKYTNSLWGDRGGGQRGFQLDQHVQFRFWQPSSHPAPDHCPIPSGLYFWCNYNPL